MPHWARRRVELFEDARVKERVGAPRVGIWAYGECGGAGERWSSRDMLGRRIWTWRGQRAWHCVGCRLEMSEKRDL